MSWIVRLMKSSLGAKYVVAVTGAGLFAFIIGHVGGNLLLYFGQDAMNSYAAGLHNLPYGLLWIARGGLLVFFGLHVYTAYRLAIQNKAARPRAYAFEDTLKASYASRTMARTGTIVLLFLIYHLAHYTFRIANYAGPYIDNQGRDDVYTMVVAGFNQPFISITYVAAMLVLGFHLSHGLSSMFQTLGINHSKYNPFFRKVMPLIGWAVCLAGATIPLAVLTGIIR
ncbi:MAG TPA: succinate dehydrogenase cytochrome b subunit [Oligoflexus sp.]|uniref:succinate dehydrogenase cytochrome b subunit n=1 Tax=Oligoflexus sp. TaxID=1971216 RepID=UPI002D32BD87|nr:succinate dehydrogenase cytochrome b subunit [Oligoflexus sp.]HYX31991.1 succinate dehydrogenase cytochrome b subunit [Oligoflexus sp.]